MGFFEKDISRITALNHLQLAGTLLSIFIAVLAGMMVRGL